MDSLVPIEDELVQLDKHYSMIQMLGAQQDDV